MFLITKKWISIFFIFALCQGTKGSKPKMLPEGSELYINEGESLQLNCTSREEIKLYYPDIKNKDEMITSPFELEKQDYGQTIIFTRPKTIHGDTGWYGCTNKDVNVNTGRYDQPNVNWKYIYVKSSTNWFVRSELKPMSAVLGESVTIPCLPTSPDYKVVLTNIESPEGFDYYFDPKIGFIIEKVKLQDRGVYQCQIKNNDDTQAINTYLRVIRPSALPKIQPTIINDTLWHVTKGQRLHVNCTIGVDSSLLYSLNWTTPQQDRRIRTDTTYVLVGPQMKSVNTELIIDGVKYEDAGEYECIFITHGEDGDYHRKSTKTWITVYDPNITYINLTLEGENQTFVRNSGDDVQWVISVDAYPTATLQWFHPDGKIIEALPNADDSNESIKTSRTSTTLKIKNVQLVDSGTYTLQATNEKEIKSLNITLIVKAPPILQMTSNLKEFYMLKHEIEISFRAIAFPPPVIICNFVKKPNFPSSEDSEEVSLEILPKSTDFGDFVTMTMIASDSGQLNCTVCNVLGCDYLIEPIFVSDVPNGFGIIDANPELTAGDDLKVTCAASIYNFTSVRWLDENYMPVRESDRVKIAYRSTRFTNRAELQINKVQNADNGSRYYCSAINDYGFRKDPEEYDLNIRVPQKPYIWQSNMNETEIDLDLSTEGHKTFELRCYAKGMPSPNVTWYKDDTPIKKSEQYIFFDKNQELHIQYLLEENSGKYRCKVENRVGTEEKWIMLTIIGKGIPKVLIISIVLLVVVCVILVIYFSIKMHREKVMRKQLMEAGLTHFEEGALECLNPELTVDDQAELLPYDKKWEFPRERLKFGKQLGFGAFGVVMKAEARGICDDETVTTVAVKMVRRSTESTYIRALASELKIMIHLGKHLNVVNLLGACTKNITKRELLVIVEYCRFGNLHNYLLRHRADFINQIDPATGKIDPTIGLDKLTRTTSVGSSNRLSANSCNSNPGAELVSYSAGTDSQNVSLSPDGCILSNNSTQPGWRSNYSGDYKDQNLKPICTQDLLSWAFQVARGMEYLSQRKVLHGDLAARNILLAEDNVVKICDFGLAKTMYKDDNYKKKGDAPLPIKWMAIESIRDRIFSTQSDIWSFGIVLWEFFTLAKTPYPGMEAEKQYQRLIEGYRMEQPEYATEDVYDIMLQCWKAKPTLRPTFTNLVANIGDLLEEGVKEHYVDLNAPYLDMNTMVLESGKNDYLTMMSAPDHEALSSPTSLYVNTPCNSPRGIQEESYLSMSPSSVGSESGIFSPRVISNNGKFEFPINDSVANINSDSESEAVEISPMLTQEDDNYLKPINVHERRAEFARQRQALKAAGKIEKDNKTDSGYCNTPQNLHHFDLNEANVNKSEVDGIKRTEEINPAKHAKDSVSSIIRTQDNYVNMPKQKDNLRKEGTVSFSNPSYVMMGSRNFEQGEQV